LPTGVRLVLTPEPEGDTVAISLFVVTPEDTTPQENAVGEMVARALFFGSARRSFEAVAASVAQVGGSLETLRAPRYVAVTCITTQSHLPEAAYLLSDALKNADFPPQALQRAYRGWLDERRKRQKTPFEAAQQTLADQMRETAALEPMQLRRVTPAQARSYFQSRYVPERTVIALAGRFAPEIAQQTFAANLDDFTRRPSHSPRLSSEPRRLQGSEKARVLPVAGQAAYALVGTDAPSVSSPDYPAFLVLQTILGIGHASRLFRQLRETAGFGYAVGAVYPADRDGPLIAYAQWDARREATRKAPSPDAPETSRHEASRQGEASSEKREPKLENPNAQCVTLGAVMDSLLTSPPGEAELERARRLAVSREMLRRERVRERAFLPGWYEAMGLGYAYHLVLPRRLAAVTREDVLRVARTYLATRAAVLLLPERPDTSD
jgi:predicted Zn-dependent peptidase